jgi:hypothetical protein
MNELSEYDKNRPLTTGEKIYAILFLLDAIFSCGVCGYIFYLGIKVFITTGGIGGVQ